jgi:hypothetical protein
MKLNLDSYFKNYKLCLSERNILYYRIKFIHLRIINYIFKKQYEMLFCSTESLKVIISTKPLIKNS